MLYCTHESAFGIPVFPKRSMQRGENMAGITYKCPNCGAYLTFDPETQQWKCPFCSSAFPESELKGKAEAFQNEAEQEAEKEAKEPSSGAQVVYHCPSCGSEIMTDETTVATHCYYCHSPVVLQGKLTADMKPDEVLPFTIGREKAIEEISEWIRTRKFVPKKFFSKAQIQEMSGVYYPHFVSECQTEGVLDGEATTSDVFDEGKYVVTNTRHYHVRREGRFVFKDILRPALSKANRKLTEGVHPFPLENAKPFSGAFLSGFLAERRDLEADSYRQEIEQELQGYMNSMLRDTASQYETCSASTSSAMKNIKTKYVLLPTWVLTYPNKKNKDDPYYYVMNGCTGQVCGKLPVDQGRLWRHGLLAGLIVAALFCVLAYFLF